MATTSTQIPTPTPTANANANAALLVEKVRAALLGLFVADALAMPTHW